MEGVYSVLTIKHLGITEEEFEKSLFTFLNSNKSRPGSVVIKEFGEGGDNPHYNLIERKYQRPDNRRITIQKFYERHSWECGVNCVKSKKVTNLADLMGIYLKKEEKSEEIYENNFYTETLREKIKKSSEKMKYPSHTKKKIISYEQAPHFIIQALEHLGYLELNYITFKEAIKYLVKDNYGVKQIFRNMTEIYIQVRILFDDEDGELEKFILKKLDKDLIYEN